MLIWNDSIELIELFCNNSGFVKNDSWMILLPVGSSKLTLNKVDSFQMNPNIV